MSSARSQTLAESTRAHDLPAVAAARRIGMPSELLLAIGAAALTFLVCRTQLSTVWLTGQFFDTDDAMRLAEVRALLRGQSWFDMTAWAMDPPHGVAMHWSRIVDIPLAVLMKTFSLFAETTVAERLTRIVFPFALLVALYLGMARLCGLLIGPIARGPAIGITVLSGNGIAQFVPGRIDHHAPQVVLLVFMLASAIAALDPRQARQGFVAGALAALSLAISLENLPFIVCLGAGLVAYWVWHGRDADRMLGWFAAGLGAGLIASFLATVGPANWPAPVCDAFGAAHLGAGLVAALGLGMVARSGLATTATRLAAAGLVAAASVTFVALFFPACLGSPFATLDPLVRDIWLNNVEEALPLTQLYRKDPSTALASLLPVVLGLAACGFAAWRSEGTLRWRFALLALLVACGLAAACSMVRVFTSVTAIALCGGLYLAVGARRWCFAHGRENLGSLSWLVLIPFTATAWSLALAPAAPADAKPGAPEIGSLSCLTPAALAPLAALAPGTVVGSLDLGSFLLAETKLAPFAGAYHRNNDGNHFVLATMLAAPDEARAALAARHVTYVVTCAGFAETRRLAERNPRSLAAALVADRIPPWLVKVPTAATPLRVYRVEAP